MLEKGADQTEVSIASQTELAEPPLYKVVLINDDRTTQEFVVDLLIKVFQKTEHDAMIIMWNIHSKGSDTVGIYPYDIAASKVQVATQVARTHGFPLQVIYERV